MVTFADEDTPALRRMNAVYFRNGLWRVHNDVATVLAIRNKIDIVTRKKGRLEYVKDDPYRISLDGEEFVLMYIYDPDDERYIWTVRIAKVFYP